MNSIFTRTSVRKFENRPVEEEKVRKLLSAAMAAPTAGNQREYEFVVVDDPAILKELAAVSPYAGPAGKAPMAIVPLGNPQLCRFTDYIPQDLGAASQNILLEAVGLGLGAVWLGIAPLTDRMEKVATILGIPEGIVPFAIIPVGYPAEQRQAADRYEATKVHYNHY